MHFDYKVAAKARGVFNKELAREEAWNSFIPLFQNLVVPYTKYDKLKGSENSISVGDVFKYGGYDNSFYYVTITAWNYLESFAYEEKWSPITGSDYDHPNASADKKNTMELKINTHFEGLTLDVRRTEYRTIGLWASLMSKISNSDNSAVHKLNLMVGPDRRNSAAYSGNWQNLPIHDVIVKPDSFNAPSIL